MLRKLFRGIVLGGIAGFIGGLLFAPKSGEKTREELKNFSEENSPKIKSFIEKVKNKLTELKENCCKMGKDEESASE